MKGRTGTVAFLVCNIIIAPVLQIPVPQNQNDLTPGVNAVDHELRYLGITGSSINWEIAFARLAESVKSRLVLKDVELKRKDEKLEGKDKCIRQLNVLNFIRSHMESFSLQLDPLFYTAKATNSPLSTFCKTDIPPEDVPAYFQERLEADFKTAYVRWYRIIMNSNDPRIAEFLKALKQEPLIERRPLTKQEIAKNLAVIWCTVCNDVHSLCVLGACKRHLVWKDENQVAKAFATFQDDGFYVDFVRIFLKTTKFRNKVVYARGTAKNV